MFGYVRPYRGELKVRELEAYQSLYCGLCHTMGRRYGFLARFLLNYDFTFLAMLLTPGENLPATERLRCVACPLRGKEVCPSNSGLEIAADESVILAYWKLRDTVLDGSFWERMAAGFLSLLFRRSYRRAAARRPAFDQRVRDCLEELHRLEQEGSPSLDLTADTFARILCAAAPASGDTAADRAMEQLLYHVGRWIYLVDAWDDLEEDLASGAYNPIHARFAGREREEQDYLRTTLRHSLNLALSAYELLDTGCWSGIVGNVLSLGLPAVEELCFRGEWKRAGRRFPRHPK